MKKLMAKILPLIMLFVLLAAPAQALEQAQAGVDPVQFERFSGYTRSGSAWAVHGSQADATLEYLADTAAGYAYNGACFFYLELTGDERLGLMTPTLVFWYAGSTLTEGTAVSLSFDGMRYDLPVAREQTSLGGVKAEKLTAFLDADGLAMLQALSQAEEAHLRIHGNRIYTTGLKRTERAQTQARTIVENASLTASDEMLALTGEYGLWDLSRAAFEQKYGLADSRMSACALEEEQDEYRLDKDFAQLSRGDAHNGVLAMQRLLVSKGFLQGEVDNRYGERTALAVRRAQRYYGLTPTGSFDRALINCLTGAAEPDGEPAPAEGETLEVSGVARVTLSRCWLAQAFAPSADQGSAAYAVSNADNLLVILDGSILNLSTEEMNLYWQLGGTIRRGDYAYQVLAVCESDQGARFGNALLPLGEARLVLYAEVPRAVLAMEGEWTLSLKIGSDTVETAFDAR